jgi:ABC-type uncharacterized transport system involved in gliding motility auxiliary subunit
MKLYYSKTAANKGTEGIRAFNSYYVYVKDLLTEYASHSRNNLILEVIDPRPDTKDEEDAIAYGLKKFHLTESERYFFGLVIENDTGTEKVIEFFDPEQKDKLEYLITKTIYNVARPAKKKVGILSSLPIQSNMNPYLAQMMRMRGQRPNESWSITQLLTEYYEIQQVSPTTEEIKGVDVLMVIHPKNLSEKTQWAIDQFVLRGGRLLLMVDPMSVVDRPKSPYGMAPGSMRSSNLEKLMNNWGVTLEKGKFAGDQLLAGVGRVGPQDPPSKLLQIINCDDRCVSSHKDIISSGLSNLVFLLPGHLKLEKKEGIEATTILGTTNKGGVYEASEMELNSPGTLWNRFSPGEGANLGVKLVGKFKSAFPDGITVERVEKGKDKKGKNAKKEKKRTEKITGLKVSKKPSSIIVFSDVDFIHNQFAFKESIFGLALANDNSSLFLNAVENLSGSKELLSIRSKGAKSRRFRVIDEIELNAEKETSQTVERIKDDIKKVQERLSKLKISDANSMAVIKSKALDQKKDLDKRLAVYKRELREVKRKGREKIEGIGKFFQYINTLLVPFLLIIGGIIFNRIRQKRIEARTV